MRLKYIKPFDQPTRIASITMELRPGGCLYMAGFDVIRDAHEHSLANVRSLADSTCVTPIEPVASIIGD